MADAKGVTTYAAVVCTKPARSLPPRIHPITFSSSIPLLTEFGDFSPE